MDRKEIERLLDLNNKEYQRKVDQAMKEKIIANQKVLNEWAAENARYAVGDYLTMGEKSMIIKVKKISGRYSTYTGPYVEYSGPVHTKALKPRKDEFESAVYDDGRLITQLFEKGKSVTSSRE